MPYKNHPHAVCRFALRPPLNSTSPRLRSPRILSRPALHAPSFSLAEPLSSSTLGVG